VINKSGRERYSCPFFYDPNVGYDVAPLPGTGAAKFAPVNYGDFLRGELQAGYDKHKAP
jgi:isopenicillin N synthase-like dioxygenase